MNEPLVLKNLSRTFRSEGGDLPVLRGADLAVRAGEIVALVAPSGAGKSTLLHLAGLLEKPDGGAVLIEGRDAATLTDAERTGLRLGAIGFVYQMHHLLSEFSAVENVMLPQMIRGLSRNEATARAAELLTYLGLKDRLTHRPAELSGGEQQRVAIARAVANAPRLLLADEPTGNLDGANAEQVFALMLELNRERGTSLIVVTHDTRLAARMERVLTLEQGVLTEGISPSGRPSAGSAG